MRNSEETHGITVSRILIGNIRAVKGRGDYAEKDTLDHRLAETKVFGHMNRPRGKK